MFHVFENAHLNIPIVGITTPVVQLTVLLTGVEKGSSSAMATVATEIGRWTRSSDSAGAAE